MKIAEFLLKLENHYQGHFQTEIKGLSVEDGLQLCKELEEYTENKYYFVLELWTCGNYTIYCKDYFPEGKMGGRDRIILSVSN